MLQHAKTDMYQTAHRSTNGQHRAFAPSQYSRRSQQALMSGLKRLATTAGIYSNARSLLLPCLLSRTLPLYLPDVRSLGIKPKKAAI